MNEIDQKLNHLQYLYEKRLKHNKEIETNLEKLNQAKEELNKMNIHFQYFLLYTICLFVMAILCIGNLVGIPFGFMIGTTVFGELVLSGAYYCITLPKRKRLKEEIKNIQLKYAQYQDKIMDHLIQSKKEEARYYKMFMQMKNEKIKLKEQLWDNHMFSSTELEVFSHIEDHYKENKEKQKTLRLNSK